jgi:nucleotide-binding universal stress UspA family protein
MFRDLMFPASGTAGDENALAAAIELASQLDAHLSLVQTINLPLPLASPWGMQPDVLLADADRDLRQAGETRAARLRDRMKGETIPWEVRIAESHLTDPGRLLSLHARHADLTIMTGPASAADDAVIRELFGDLLLESGRPLLVIPSGHQARLPATHVVVAWQPTREATRALHDALPFLLLASSVDVVTVDPVVSESGHGQDPGVDIGTHLARHGLEVNVVAIPHRGEGITQALLRHATESGAQLLVAGGYGHTRLRAWMLGGTTRELLQAAHIPVLYSH